MIIFYEAFIQKLIFPTPHNQKKLSDSTYPLNSIYLPPISSDSTNFILQNNKIIKHLIKRLKINTFDQHQCCSMLFHAFINIRANFGFYMFECVFWSMMCNNFWWG